MTRKPLCRDPRATEGKIEVYAAMAGKNSLEVGRHGVFSIQMISPTNYSEQQSWQL